MNGLIGRKIGMTSIYAADGKNIACTVVEALPNVVTQVKTIETDGYDAVQLGYGEAKEKHTTKSFDGHFAKAETTPKKKLVEFRNYPLQKSLVKKFL
jgi:large subunit ribosomal protein L3